MINEGLVSVRVNARTRQDAGINEPIFFEDNILMVDTIDIVNISSQRVYA